MKLGDQVVNHPDFFNIRKARKKHKCSLHDCRINKNDEYLIRVHRKESAHRYTEVKVCKDCFYLLTSKELT